MLGCSPFKIVNFTNDTYEMPDSVDRDQLANEYFETLRYEPYPVQEEALLAWFTSEQGVLVCAPTGTGKTLIAEAAVFEALKTGKRCYYTTPLIALTEQKLDELRQSAVRWGFPESSVGLITGTRRVNADAPILVVVAEILLNRLLNTEAFDFDDTASVVMDEFHSFNDPERGIVWELSLGLLPPHVRTMLLSATVGNSFEFSNWLRLSHNRKLQLVEGTERKVPLSYWWINDALLDEHMEAIADGDESLRRTPALLFCFNREECWRVAELLKGKKLIDKARQEQLASRLAEFDLSEGAGPKLKQILQRGVGVHHAAVMPKYRRIVESLFQEKLLSVCVCTETLSAGINLPARSVVLPTILKGPYNKKKLIDPSNAHQMFGRAGRPQYDDQGFVFALAHEDDVKLLRWRERYDQIPEDTKDPGLMRAKKQLKKKMPKRNSEVTYWTEEQFEKLRNAPAADLQSRGPIPWRLLAYMLEQSSDVQPIRDFIGRRLMDDRQKEQARVQLNEMLITLWTAGYLNLEPKPKPKSAKPPTPSTKEEPTRPLGLLEAAGLTVETQTKEEDNNPDEEAADASRGFEVKDYRPDKATTNERADMLVRLRSVHPLYGVFLANQLAFADATERIEALESVLELPNSIAKHVRVPKPEEHPPGLLATSRLDHQLLELGLASVEELAGQESNEEGDSEPASAESSSHGSNRGRQYFQEPPKRILTFADKLRRLFDFEFPKVHDLRTNSVWVVGELLNFNGDFNQYIRAHGLQKHEGMLFRHVLRFTMLLDEMANIPPAETEPEDWEDWLDSLADRLLESCRAVDAESTSEWIDRSQQQEDELLVNQKTTAKARR